MRKTLALLTLLLLLIPTPVTAAPKAATYTNPVSAGTVDTFPDPATIKAKDGRWYAYGTTNPIRNSAGETGEHILPMLSSADLVHWAYAGDVFALIAKPSWWPAGTRPWAPDIRYFDNHYHLTYSLSVGGIGLATSDNPAGPWTDRGQIVPAASGCPSGTIDQAMFQDTDGTYYLYWGSYDTICVSRMNANATGLTGAVTQVGRGRRMEGGFVVHRDGFYYLFYSDGGCCDGAFSGYVTKVARATSPLGPFTTPSGVNLMELTSKDGIVVAGDGNGWVGPGHNAITTDLAGQDWLVYHGIPEADPDFPPVTGANGATLDLTRRPLLIDRLDWIGGWPVLRAGAGPSTTPQTAPVTSWTVGSTFTTTAGFGTNWTLTDGHLSAATPSTVLSTAAVTGDVRVEGDVRGDAAGLVLGYRSPVNQIVARLDSATRRLVLDVTVAGVTTTSAADLPANFNYRSWHTIALERRGRALVAEVSADRLRDATGTISVTLPAGVGNGRIGATSRSGSADVDNLGAAPLYAPVTTRVATPVPGQVLPAYSDEFTGSVLGAGWSWVRGDPGVTVAGGSLSWPTQASELALGTNTASVLLRDTPPADFLVETELHFDGVRGNQQAGLILYETDDRFVKLVHSVLPLANGNGAVLQQTEFTKEDTRTSTNQVFAGPMFGGPAPATTWLRLKYHYDAANNANDIRMASSTDGTTWEWGGAWSFPHRAPLKLGLVSMNTAGAMATFDHVRTYAQ
jgi:arabinan endo-1,5-alpha-L-arabinosidase